MTSNRTRTEPAAPGRAGIAVPILLDIAVPVVVYYVLSALGASDLVALSAGGVVPAVRVVYGAVRDRSVDGLAVLVLLIIAGSFALTFVSGDARFALAKESVFTGAAALWVLGTTVVGKPMIYTTLRPFATRDDPARERAWDSLWEGSPAFHALIRDLTVAWGLAFLGDALLRLVVVVLVPVKQAVLLVHVPGVILLVAAILYTKSRGGSLRRMLDAETEAEAGR